MPISEVISGWEQYLNEIPPLICDVYDLQAHRERLLKLKERLFSGHGDIEVWRHKENDNLVIRGIFSGQNIDTTRESIYFVHQLSSWSPLQTSLETMQKLLAGYKVCPDFLEAIYAFGAKVTMDDDTYFNLCYHRTYSSLAETLGPHHATGYILRTVEKHGRTNLKDPWSLRQMAVYQKYDCTTKRSVWILIQPFRRCKEALWSSFPQAARSGSPLELHIQMISSSLLDWRWYLNDIRKLIFQFNEKALKSSLTPRTVDYETNFNDCQRLQEVINKLSLSQEVLESTLQVAYMIERQHKSRGELPDGTFREYADITSGIQTTIQKTHGFKRTAAALEKQAEGTSCLLSNLLNHRKADLLTTQAHVLAGLGAQSITQGDQIKRLAEVSHKDSRSMKIVTFIATFYLPANLVAAIFSSGLVRLPSDVVEPRLLSIQGAMWVYVLSSLVLTVVTIAGAYLWNRRTW